MPFAYLSPIASRTISLRSTSDKVQEKEHSIKHKLEDISNKNTDLNSRPAPYTGAGERPNFNVLPLPQRQEKGNKLLARRNISHLERLTFDNTNVDLEKRAEKVAFLKMIRDQINIDEYNEKQCGVLFDRLYDMKLELENNHSENYKSVKGSRYEGELKYCEDTLIKSNGIVLPANNVSADGSPYMTIASQYPLNNTESLRNYFNMLFDNNINTVYILASNNDIKKDLSKLGSEYNKSDFKKDGFKYFREDLNLGDISSIHIEKWMLSKKSEECLDCKVYTKLVTKENSDEKKKINFVHIYDWKDHTAIDATELKNTIDIVGDNLKINPIEENIAVHCLAGLGRTGEFIALMEMMKIIEARKIGAGNTEEKSLESIITDLREKRSIKALYRPEQIAELVKIAIDNKIPLLN